MSTHRRSLQKSHMLALAWLLSLLFSIPQAFVFRSTVDEETGQEKYTCITDFVEGWGRQVSPTKIDT